MNTPAHYYAHGKLLLSGEYAVLDGALAWAVPTRFGQWLEIYEDSPGLLVWQALDFEHIPWFEATLKLSDLSVVQYSDKGFANRLKDILKAVRVQNPDFLKTSQGTKVVTRLEFPQDWGLGSSSTLISLIAEWTQVDAFQLLSETFGGSGYDIACAKSDNPILFNRLQGHPIWEVCTHLPPFKENIYFVHLGQKQNSREGIARYRESGADFNKLSMEVTLCTVTLQAAQQLDTFQQAMEWHESIIAEALQLEKVKEKLFPDFEGSIKSLGAWGGDFIMVATALPTMEVLAYFNNKGYDTVLTWDEMVLSAA
ncbi:GYDIA family GHMP kinase [soil metagenome]